MALQAAVQGAAAEIGDGVLQTTKHIVQGQQSPSAKKRNHDGFLPAGVSTSVLFGVFGPMGSSVVVVRPRHLRTVFAFQAVAGGKGAGALFRRLELGSNTRVVPRGAPVKKPLAMGASLSLTDQGQ